MTETQNKSWLFDFAGSTVDNGFWEELLGPGGVPNAFGWNLTNRTGASLGMTIAIMCGWVIARDVAKADMRLTKASGDRWDILKSSEHWFAKMLAGRPNSLQTWGDFWRMSILQYKLTNNAYFMKRINRQGDVLELVPIPSWRVRERTTSSGRLVYEVTVATEYDTLFFNARENYLVSQDRMVHVRGRTFDGLRGQSNSELASPILGLIDSINAFQTKVFGNDGTSNVVFETKDGFGSGEMADAAFRRLKDQLRQGVKRMRMGEALLLEAGLTAKELSQTAQESAAGETYTQMVNRICGLMECPPHKIYHTESVKYDNQATMDLDYYVSCLKPITKNFEECFQLSLFSEDEWDVYWPEFNTREMTVLDSKAINELIKVGMTTGVMKINEARELLGFNPVAGGDVFLIPVNMSVMKEDGTIKVQAATGQNQGGNNPQGSQQPQKDLKLVVNE